MRDYTDFFVALAGSAATIIGLLVVAVSIAAERDKVGEIKQTMEARAASSLLCLSNVLFVALIYLLPGAGLGVASIIFGIRGVLFSLSQARVAGKSMKTESRGSVLTLMLVLFILFTYETVVGFMLTHNEASQTLTDTECGILLGTLGIGIARAWTLVGIGSNNASFYSTISMIITGHPRN